MTPAAPPSILFLGKRHYTNKDALLERFGRIYQLPLHWARQGARVHLWLVDYHGRQTRHALDEALRITSAPALGWHILLLPLTVLRLRPQLIVASGDCYIGLLAWLLACLCGARFVFDIYDKYDEFGAYRAPPGMDLFAFLRRRAWRRFYASLPLLQALGDQPQQHNAVVPNGVDSAAFAPLDATACRVLLGLPSGKLVGYFGSMEPVRGVDDLVQAVERLRGAGEDLRLVLCGKAAAAVPPDRDWIVFRGLVPHAEIPAYINACDVVALPYRQSALLDGAASCKIAEYLSCERPLVSTRTPNFLENFAAEAALLGAGLCNPGDPADLARAVSWQLREQRVLPAPRSLNWHDIAAQALAAIRE